VVEYKSPSHPYRSGQLDRLWGYVHTYFANQCALPHDRAGAPLTPADGGPEVREREELCAVLVVAKRSNVLSDDVAAMGLTWEELGAGYLKLHGGLFTLYVVELDVACPDEGDDLLHSFGHGTVRSPETVWFWTELVGSKEMAMTLQDMEGYKELMDQLLDAVPAEQVLSHYAPEQVLSHYAPEQRLAGLDRDHQALALPIEVVRLLPETYLRSLSPEVAAEIRRRLRPNGR
jgi:hypothetical protein